MRTIIQTVLGYELTLYASIFTATIFCIGSFVGDKTFINKTTARIARLTYRLTLAMTITAVIAQVGIHWWYVLPLAIAWIGKTRIYNLSLTDDYSDTETREEENQHVAVNQLPIPNDHTGTNTKNEKHTPRHVIFAEGVREVLTGRYSSHNDSEQITKREVATADVE